MAVDAQVFPVGAVGRIVVMIAVFMMHSQKLLFFVVKFFATLGADETMYLQRAFPVVAGGRNVLPQFSYNLFSGFTVAFCLRPSRFMSASVGHNLNLSFVAVYTCLIIGNPRNKLFPGRWIPHPGYIRLRDVETL